MALTRPTLAQMTTGIARISDPITTLHAGFNTANVDIGFLMNRANGLVSNVALYWNETGNTFVTAFTSNTGETNSNVTVTNYANLSTGAHTITPAVSLPSTSTATGALVVTGGVGISGNLFAGNVYANGLFWSGNGNVISTGGGTSSAKYTATTTAPSSPSVGDQWYYTTGDILYEYQNVGTGSFWIDITSPIISSGTVTTTGGDLSPFLLMGA